jgi:hypothetical protein
MEHRKTAFFILAAALLAILALQFPGISSAINTTPAPNLSNDPLAIGLSARIYAQIEVNATSQAEAEAYVRNHSIVVIGQGTDLAEKMLFEDLKASNPLINSSREADDSAGTLEDIKQGKYVLVVLIGGPEQNSASSYVKEKGYLNESMDLYGEVTIESGKAGGVVYVMASDKRGYTRMLERQSVQSSPLAAFMEPQYVPVAATIITLILLALVNVARTVFEFKALNIGRKGKELGEKAIRVMGIDLAEIGAIFGASFVLGLSISWQYFGNARDFAFWVAINTIICLVGAILHELTHRIFAHLFGIKIEYRFWPEGSVLTLVSSYLGNAFSIQAFLLEEIPEDIAKWKVGVMKLAAPMMSAIVMVSFAMLNQADPNPVYQVIYSTSALWAMAEMLPFSGLDGHDIKEWSHLVWFVSFLLIGAAYCIVTFLL